MKKPSTRAHWMLKSLTASAVLWGLFTSSSAYAAIDSYSRTPSGAEIEKPPGVVINVITSGWTGEYLCIYLNYNPSTGYNFATGYEITSSPQSFEFDVTDLPLGDYYEVGYVRYSNPGCSTGYLYSNSMEYDGGATLFSVVDAPEPPPDPTVATTTPDAFPHTLFYGIVLMMIGFLVPLLAARLIDRGY